MGLRLLTGDDSQQAALGKQVRAARLKNARGISTWTEVAQTDLVARGRWTVLAETDEALTPVRGVVFDPRSATVIADRASYVFYVDQEGDCVFFERSGLTWTAIYARRVSREMRARR